MHYMQKMKNRNYFNEKVFHKYTDICAWYTHTNGKRQRWGKHENWQRLHK